jgi:hypothetical protein
MDGYAAAFGLGGGVGMMVGIWAATWWRDRRPTRQERLVRRVYRHLDEIIGATKNENQIRADLRFRVIHKRRWFWWLVPNTKRLPWRRGIANFFWPVPQIGTGTSPIPSDKRIAYYVWPSVDLRTWTVRYSPEAPANHQVFIEWLTRGLPRQGGGLAQALGLEWRPDLFKVERNWSEGLVHLTVAGPAAVPDDLDLRGEVNGAR